MNLSLQDYAAEVKVVSVGVDVLEVARAFNPDIIFIDVLLQKKNGYEVCKELRDTSELSKLPIVLMWSSFMDLDEAKASTCGATDRLEKPFDSDRLRGIVKKHVKKLESNPLAGHMSVPQFDKSATAETAAPIKAGGPPPVTEIPPKPQVSDVIVPIAPETKATATPNEVPQPAHEISPTTSNDSSNETWNMESFDDINNFQAPTEVHQIDEGDEEFQNVPLSTLPDQKAKSEPQAPKGFEIDIPDDDFDGVTVNFVEPSEDIQDLSFLKIPEAAKEKAGIKEPESSPKMPEKPVPEMRAPESPTPIVTEAPKPQKVTETSPAGTGHLVAEPTLSAEEQRRVIEETVARIVRDLVPDLATRVIKEELDRLLSEPESP
ncbi:MAG: response regulator [Bdellovibrionales bacterium]|nr:response regulator [Bdellovibrionales bacterium]